MCDDLVESFHLLLCCIDLMFLNALMSKSRRELLNPTFKGLIMFFEVHSFLCQPSGAYLLEIIVRGAYLRGLVKGELI